MAKNVKILKIWRKRAIIIVRTHFQNRTARVSCKFVGWILAPPEVIQTRETFDPLYGSNNPPLNISPPFVRMTRTNQIPRIAHIPNKKAYTRGAGLGRYGMVSFFVGDLWTFTCTTTQVSYKQRKTQNDTVDRKQCQMHEDSRVSQLRSSFSTNADV